MDNLGFRVKCVCAACSAIYSQYSYESHMRCEKCRSENVEIDQRQESRVSGTRQCGFESHSRHSAPQGATHVTVAKNKAGEWFPIAYGTSEQEALENGQSSHRNMATVGAIIKEKKTLTLDEWKLQEAKSLIQSWVDQQGHERCWYYPDLFRQLAHLFDVKMAVEPKLPPLPEFKLGCERYQKEEYEQQEKPILSAMPNGKED